MRNIMFTTYFSNLEEFVDLPDYNSILELLMIPFIQDKINRTKGIKKIMISLSSSIENDFIDHFINNYNVGKKPALGIINLPISTKNINWNTLTSNEKKEFLMEKWKILFTNLSDDYFVVDKSEVIKSLEELEHSEWNIISTLFKKKLKYNDEKYEIVLDISPERAQLTLIRESDNKKIKLRDYQTRNIVFDLNFKSFKLVNDDTLMLENRLIFLPPEVFELKKIIN